MIRTPTRGRSQRPMPNALPEAPGVVALHSTDSLRRSSDQIPRLSPEPDTRLALQLPNSPPAPPTASVDRIPHPRPSLDMNNHPKLDIENPPGPEHASSVLPKSASLATKQRLSTVLYGHTR